MNFLRFLAFILAAVVVSALDNCPTICPDIYEPICANNGNEFKQFASECNLRFENCQLKRSGSNTKFIPCETELCNLPKDFFESESDSESESVENKIYEKLASDEIESSAEYTNPNCVRACSLIHLPVCATNGKVRRSFGNRCMLETQNCISNNAWKMTRNGEC